MRKVVCFLGIVLLIVSCTKNEVVFSCDPEIDAIVKSGEINTTELTLAEFLEYDLDLQKALFRSFPIEKRKAFWMEKLDSVQANVGNSEPEILHIKKLKDFVDTNYGTLDIEQQYLFENQWISYSRNTLLWEDAKIFFIVNSLCISQEQYEYIYFPDYQIQSQSSRWIGTCSCNTESDYCAQSGGLCQGSARCSATVDGCGWLWQYSCNGSC